jgi:hypothetical protein
VRVDHVAGVGIRPGDRGGRPASRTCVSADPHSGRQRDHGAQRQGRPGPPRRDQLRRGVWVFGQFEAACRTGCKQVTARPHRRPAAHLRRCWPRTAPGCTQSRRTQSRRTQSRRTQSRRTQSRRSRSQSRSAPCGASERRSLAVSSNLRPFGFDESCPRPWPTPRSTGAASLPHRRHPERQRGARPGHRRQGVDRVELPPSDPRLVLVGVVAGVSGWKWRTRLPCPPR